VDAARSVLMGCRVFGCDEALKIGLVDSVLPVESWSQETSDAQRVARYLEVRAMTDLFRISTQILVRKTWRRLWRQRQDLASREKSRNIAASRSPIVVNKTFEILPALASSASKGFAQ
jgi:enoyl-CoA hydratase/carnithine racemase